MSQPSQPKKPLPPDYEVLEFSVESEDWNEYELKDGARIRGRVFLSKIMRDPYDPQNMEFGISSPTWVVYVPASMRGAPNVRPGDKVVGAKYEVHVVRNHEPWNVYRILKTGQKLKIKLTVDEVSRFVDKFDQQGMPVYQVPNGVAINISSSDVEKAQ